MGIFTWLKKILTFDPSVYKPPVDTNNEPGASMTEGDFRSGSGGYSPNTSYPDSFYGSGGQSDGNHNEGDFNR
jgi:hypothetical protein